MKTYKALINKVTYIYFYDKYIKSWTVIQVDANENQVGDAEYFANKESLLSNYNFNFKEN
jgi:hypothetical protein